MAARALARRSPVPSAETATPGYGPKAIVQQPVGQFAHPAKLRQSLAPLVKAINTGNDEVNQKA